MEIEKKLNVQAIFILILLILISSLFAVISMAGPNPDLYNFLLGVIFGPTALTASYPCIYLLIFHVFKVSTVFHKEQGVYYVKWMIALNILFILSLGSILDGTIYWLLLTMIFQILLCIYFRFKILKNVANKNNQSFNLDSAKSAPPVNSNVKRLES